MSTPLSATTPMPRVPNSLCPPLMYALSQTSSISVGPIPSIRGFKIFSMITSINSPLPEQEPKPVIPSSVSTWINVVDRVFLTPDRLNTCRSSGIEARKRIARTSVIFIDRLRHLPKFSLYCFAVHHDKLDFLVRSFVSFGINAQNFWSVTFFRAHSKQRQRLIAGALK